MDSIEMLLKKAKEANDGYAYAELGDAYWYGRGVFIDLSQAAEYYKKAADLGVMRGQERIGIMYYEGNGVVKNIKLAKQYLKSAAEQGSVRALNDLGWICFNGDYGFFAGKGKAFEFWEKAAKQGSAEAQIYIASSYLTDAWGDGKSIPKAAYWYMCAYQNRKANDAQIKEAKAKLDMLSEDVNLNRVKDEIVRKHPEYLCL